MPRRVLIISDDTNVLKVFLSQKDLLITVSPNYIDGIEKLLYEKPDAAVVDITKRNLSTFQETKINTSGEFGIHELGEGFPDIPARRPVLALRNIKDVNDALRCLKSYLDHLDDLTAASSDSESEGNLETVYFPKLLISLYAGRKTGILDILSSSRLRICIQNGLPVSAEGGDINTAVGRMLLDHGKINSDLYEEVMRTSAESNKKTGQILVEMGLLSPHELNSLLEQQVKEKIIGGFRYSKGTYRFKPESVFPGNIIAYDINPLEVIYAGVRKHIDAELIVKADPLIKLNEDPPLRIPDLGLKTAELRFAQLLRKERFLHRIIDESNLEREATVRLVYFLGLCGITLFPENFLEETGRQSAALIRNDRLYGNFLDLDNSAEESADSDQKASQESSERTEPRAGQPGKIPGTNETRHGLKLDPDYSYKGQEPDVLDAISTENRNEHGSSGNQADKSRETEDKLKVLTDRINRYHESLPDMDIYAKLGVPRKADAGKIKNAYYKLVKDFHPDANPGLEQSVREKAQEIFTSITHAYETLMDEDKRIVYDSDEELSELKNKAQTLYEAEMAYKKAKNLLNQRNYAEAEKKFSEALALNPDEAAYIGAQAWAKYLASGDKDAAFEDTRKKLEKALSMKDGLAENYFYLGSLLKNKGNITQAEKQFRSALAIEPGYIEASRELRLIMTRKRASNVNSKDKKLEKRFWSGLFKK